MKWGKFLNARNLCKSLDFIFKGKSITVLTVLKDYLTVVMTLKTLKKVFIQSIFKVNEK